jgi:hypothetical protein
MPPDRTLRTVSLAGKVRRTSWMAAAPGSGAPGSGAPGDGASADEALHA